MELLNSYFMAMRPFLRLAEPATGASVAPGTLAMHRNLQTLDILLDEVRDTLKLWKQRRRQRLCLRELNSHLLRDIGVERREALWEARKPFWRA